ncbi:hypothetical protein DAEQUDRAFT_147551 [Daedalea quercina L-15889]|uniref:Uncharacterized protein n=1 Tax=Daedalea quercina L-15889 TaxID=1314783 RepID=A0A165KN29_9APHY|nr:hypothetical protein DAEQUDRAFT_147551 [Daedalea quercina L-15889]
MVILTTNLSLLHRLVHRTLFTLLCGYIALRMRRMSAPPRHEVSFVSAITCSYPSPPNFTTSAQDSIRHVQDGTGRFAHVLAVVALPGPEPDLRSVIIDHPARDLAEGAHVRRRVDVEVPPVVRALGSASVHPVRARDCIPARVRVSHDGVATVDLRRVRVPGQALPIGGGICTGLIVNESAGAAAMSTLAPNSEYHLRRTST